MFTAFAQLLQDWDGLHRPLTTHDHLNHAWELAIEKLGGTTPLRLNKCHRAASEVGVALNLVCLLCPSLA